MARAMQRAAMEQFKVREDYGHWFVRDLDGRFLDAVEIRMLIQALLQTHKLLNDGTCSTQAELLESVVKAEADRMLDGAEIHYPATDDFLSYRENQRRPLSAPRVTGVYVLTSPAKPGQVKIGVSSDVYL